MAAGVAAAFAVGGHALGVGGGRVEVAPDSALVERDDRLDLGPILLLAVLARLVLFTLGVGLLFGEVFPILLVDVHEVCQVDSLEPLDLFEVALAALVAVVERQRERVAEPGGVGDVHVSGGGPAALDVVVDVQEHGAFGGVEDGVAVLQDLDGQLGLGELLVDAGVARDHEVDRRLVVRVDGRYEHVVVLSEDEAVAVLDHHLGSGKVVGGRHEVNELIPEPELLVALLHAVHGGVDQVLIAVGERPPFVLDDVVADFGEGAPSVLGDVELAEAELFRDAVVALRVLGAGTSVGVAAG
mmetsp:Transcript_5988/g.10989  ORF Transcript_5988/g.10989 Transcript_5988/m.10989 type:complete len:299 (+) Transcript_5988:1662-2558(+)